MRRLVADRRGATTIEYGFILAMVFLAIMGVISALAGSTTDMWGSISTAVMTVVGGT